MKNYEKALMQVIRCLYIMYVFSGCQQEQPIQKTAVDKETVDAIAASNAVYFEAFVKNDSSLFIDRYADDACIMAPFAPQACSKENIIVFFRIAYENYGLRNGKFITTALYGSGGDFVVEEGLWVSYNASGELFDDGKFLVLWKKTDKGWKMFRDSFSSNRPMQGNLKVIDKRLWPETVFFTQKATYSNKNREQKMMACKCEGNTERFIY